MAKNVLLKSIVIVVLCFLCLVAAWHPEKKVMKWNPSFFRPSSYRMCGNAGSPCGQKQKHYSIYWRSTACCYGLECIEAGHGSFCTEPSSDESPEDDPQNSDLAANPL